LKSVSEFFVPSYCNGFPTPHELLEYAPELLCVRLGVEIEAADVPLDSHDALQHILE
jgi:hypothetical protein